ncbi:ATPase, T2SS/T4P/T4SS family [uncultured Sphingomonas sp.]|uniref:ATPase, T2SS/T4P/T4SS family n=1 Tax=uncultured Sphingomonas sp. TaxID=158754 RepID=UPI0025E4433F|nr:ATPase, T2SS/T4P/T4SS family [uncultured Sphingomonas sp.]
MLEALLLEAAAVQASHLHLEPRDGGVRVAFRAGGRVQQTRALQWAEGELLLREIALGAGLSPTPLLPQRGELRWGREALGVFMLPLVQGHRVVLARTPLQAEYRELEALGMRGALAQGVREVLAGAGLVLVAAPAGHGRSTTLRTLLALAANDSRPALAVAGGDTRALPGVAWADGSLIAPAELLRAGAEQDLDVLMIDSLADRAAAAAAVQAAQAGRLVLAGIDTGDAIAAIQQMRSWRVEAFQLASTLALVLGQRLVRRLCPECREPVQATGSVSALLGFDPGAIVYAPAGCSACGGSGFAGQIGVFESIRGDGTIRRLVNDGGDAAILARHAFISTPNLGSAARALARTGVTTPEEAVRISRG